MIKPVIDSSVRYGFHGKVKQKNLEVFHLLALPCIPCVSGFIVVHNFLQPFLCTFSIESQVKVAYMLSNCNVLLIYF